MTQPFTPEDVARVAAGLSEPQRDALRCLHPDDFLPATGFAANGMVAKALARRGMLSADLVGVGPGAFIAYEYEPLGLAVRTHILTNLERGG